MRRKFLNYAIAVARKGRGYVVTAEYTTGYEILSNHNSLPAARSAMKRYQAADANGRARHIDDLKKEIGNAEIGINDDGSFIAPDGMLWFPARRKGWFMPVAKVQGWRPR